MGCFHKGWLALSMARKHGGGRAVLLRISHGLIMSPKLSTMNVSVMLQKCSKTCQGSLTLSRRVEVPGLARSGELRYLCRYLRYSPPAWAP